ncbi:hypothetical protein HRbin16_02112 [bacterium HR16]|nr:hypothetical protein HRbin16_02112 [bacterium HR16]
MMPRSFLFFSLAVTALIVVGLVLHALRKPEAYQRQKNEAIRHACALYAVLGDEVPASGIAAPTTAVSDNFTYTTCMVDLYDSNCERLATFAVDMFSRELLQVTCPPHPSTADLLTRAQAYWVARDYARNLGMMVSGQPWELVKVETDARTPQTIRFCWALDRCILRVAVDRTNSRLVSATTRKLGQNGYVPR